MAEPVTEMMKQSIIVGDSVPELDGKVNQIKTELSWKIQKILGFFEKEDCKKGSVGGLIEYFRIECVPNYKHVDKYFLRKEDHEISNQSDNSQKKKWELNAVIQELSVSEVTLLTRVVEDTKHSFKNQAASQAEALTTNAETIQQKLNVLEFQKEEADATIAKQRAEISKLTEELTRAGNLKLELDKIDEKNHKTCKKLVDQVVNRKKDLKSTEEEVSKVREILQLKEAQAKMISKVGEEINETIKGMDTLSMKFEVEFGLLVSGSCEMDNEVKVVKKWIAGRKSKQDELKQEIARLEEEKGEMEALQKSIRRLNQSVKRGEEKIGELEKMIAEKDEQMKEMETKISEKESMISSLSKTLGSVISTAITKIK